MSQTRKDDGLPWAGRSASDNRADYRRELTELIGALRNVPSLAMWVPFNESWGQFDSIAAARLAASLDPTRLVHPTRLVDHASGYFDQRYGDIVSIHDYRAKPVAPQAGTRARAGLCPQ